MSTAALIEIYLHGKWTPAASIEPLGDEHARVEYLPEYIFATDRPVPISLNMPVELTPIQNDGSKPLMPAFLYDLVPQGKGRKLLIGLLDLRDHEGLALPLLLNGAFNPIGALRVDQAVQFHARYLEQNPPPDTAGGFTFRELAERTENVIDYLSTHSMLAAGTTGVQGAAPKLLLSADQAGRLHPDMALPDDQTCSHWLLKGPRGNTRDDQLILQNEAAYLRVAAACGLHVHAIDDIELQGQWLKMRRFDRQATESGVQRLAQESLASLTGLQGFGRTTTLNRLLDALRTHSSDPLADTVEFLQRDVLNQALRNTDNHARNHALQRRPDGSIRLTPLFDFAPMFKDPELIPRALHWTNEQGKRLTEWNEILNALELPADEVGIIATRLERFAETIGKLPQLARDAGVDSTILEACRHAIAAQADSLARIR